MLWIRQVHSAAGLIVALFLLEHLTATAMGWSPLLFGRYMQFVQTVLGAAPWLRALVLLPLAVAVAFGGYLLVTAGIRYQVKKCNRGGKLRYWLQRASAIALLAFLGFHLWTLKDFAATVHASSSEPAGRGCCTVSKPAASVDSPQTTFTASVGAFQTMWPTHGVFYPVRILAILGVLVGTWAAVYHLSNGLWSGAIAWGFIETPGAQQRWGRVCMTIGIVLAVLGTMGWYAFSVA